ncbi:MAG TPA: hypothetical protein VI790_03935 [Candidatus Nanoarchaeia archaeon]|nr:hypothetical protein [Candidatus Nanoarchaeia archaeon]
MFDIYELIDIVITIVIAGYILQPLVRGSIKNSFILAGASIVLHELGHKFIAMSAGFSAVYHANYSGLGLGLILRMFGAPVFFVPAYVSISGTGSMIGYLFTALAGPLTNLVLFLVCSLLLNKFNEVKWVQNNDELIASLRIINMWLAIINILPIPGTDGFNALRSLLSL